MGLLLLAGTMSLNQLAENQAGWFTDWYVFQQPLGALIFFIAATAEANRTPFDLTEADSEIVAGFATEYSGMRFGFFFFAEYVNVFVISALIVTLFFGGWNAPFPWPWPITLNLDPGQLGIDAADPDRSCRSSGRSSSRRRSSCRSLHGVAGAGHRVRPVQPVSPSPLIGIAYVGLDWVAGLLWFLGKTYVFVFTFVWMRGTLPAGPDRPADGLRLEVAAAGVAAQPVRDGGRDPRGGPGEARR